MFNITHRPSILDIIKSGGFIGLFILSFIFSAKSSLAFDLPTNFDNQQVISNLDEPDSLQFSPDGRMFISERVTGQLRVAKYNSTTDSWQLNAQPFYIFDIPKDGLGNPQAHRSAGLRDFTFDPDFVNNGYIYIFYMPNADKHNRVVRIKADSANPDVADSTFNNGLGEELLLRMPFNNQISTGSHNGGAMEFGNNGKLYISTGDGWEGDYPGDAVQSLSTFTGKIFRINPDGSIPNDNPFYSQTTGDYRAIYALGLRNPYAISKHPDTGLIYINEARGTNKAEIYIVEAGANYRHEGSTSGIGTNRQPWANASTAGGQLITGGAWYPSSGGTFPAQYQGAYFTPLWGGNNEPKGQISYIQSDSNTTVTAFELNVGLNDSNGLAIKPVMTQVGPDGDLYYLLTTYLTSEGTVQRVRWTGQQTVETPILTPPGGSYAGSQSVSMSTATAGADIRYTTDGTEPTNGSPLYTTPLTVDTTAVIKAKAFNTGMNPSGTASGSYIIGSTGTNIPPVVDAGDDQTVYVGTTVTLDGSGTTDPDGDDDLLFGELWTQLSGPPVTILDYTEEIAYFTPLVAGVYQFSLEMSDSMDTGYDEVTFTAIEQPVATFCNGNVMPNPGFEDGTSSWTFYSINGGSLAVSTPAYSGESAARAVVHGSSSNIQLYQPGLSLEPNTAYRLSFAAYSTAGRNIKVSLLEHDQDFTNYGLNNVIVDLSDTWSVYTVDFTSSGFGAPVNDGRFRFWLASYAQAGDIFWFDDLCLTKLSNLTQPGTSTLISPIGSSNTAVPVFEWTEATNATDYTLVAYDTTHDAIVYSGKFTAAAICTGGTCTAEPGILFTVGAYKWLVQAENNGVKGPWSVYLGP